MLGKIRRESGKGNKRGGIEELGEDSEVLYKGEV